MIKFWISRWFFLVLFVLVLGPFSLGAQAQDAAVSLKQKVLTQYTEKAGLPSNTILGVLQDRQGYIWMASYEGLIRFDGQKVTLINKTTSNTFLANSARTLLETREGTLFIGTNTDGLAMMKDGGFQLFGTESELPNLSVRSMVQDSEGRVWIGTADGVAVYDGGKITAYDDKITPGLGIVNILQGGPGGSILAASNSPGIWELTTDGAKPFRVGQGFDQRIFFAMAQDAQGVLWLGTSLGEILRIQFGEPLSVFQHPAFTGYAINDFFVDSKNTLWISTDRGILVHKDGRFFPFEPELELFKDVIYSIKEDWEGNIWIATKSNGIFKISIGKFSNLGQAEGLVQNSVNALAEDRDGGLWIGTDGGVSYWKNGRFVDHPAVKALKDIRIRHILIDEAGRPWFSTYSPHGLAYWEGGALRSITVDERLPVNRVRLAFQDSKGRIWIGTTAGLALWERGQIAKVFGQQEGLPNQFIMALEEDKNGNIWIGTDGGGLAVLSPQGKIEIYNTSNGLSGNVVFRFFRDTKDQIWVATSDGVSFWDGKKFHNINTKKGLLSDTVFQILTDDKDQFWFSTNKGIQIVPRSQVIQTAVGTGFKMQGRVWDQRDGLAGQITSTSWAAKGKTGLMYWPTLQGVSILNLEKLPINALPPPVIIELVDIDGTSHLEGEELIIEPSQSRLTLDFTALSYQVPEKVQFQYILAGYDKDWTPLVFDREATYTNLPAGSYEFKVRAVNNDGVPSQSEAVQKIYKQPHYYESPFFYILVAGLLISVGFFMNSLRVNQLKIRKAELENLVKERTKDLESEKAKTEALLLNIFPPLVAQQLKEKGSATPETFNNVTVLFADIVEFTPKTAAMEPAAVIHELNEIFAGFDAIVTGHRCERIKTIGDAYLAVCGMPKSDPDHAAFIARAALDMMAFIEGRNKIHLHKWEIRIGIHTGKVVGGVVGIKRYVYDIFGDTINTASRMETNSKPMMITVSQETAQILQPHFLLTERAERKIKGKGSMKMYFLKSGQGDTGAPKS